MADQVQGRPTMVTAMMRAATTQPAAIHRPPNRIQSRLSRSERGDMGAAACSGLGPPDVLVTSDPGAIGRDLVMGAAVRQPAACMESVLPLDRQIVNPC